MPLVCFRRDKGTNKKKDIGDMCTTDTKMYDVSLIVNSDCVFISIFSYKKRSFIRRKLRSGSCSAKSFCLEYIRLNPKDKGLTPKERLNQRKNENNASRRRNTGSLP
ncbi:hypothetical protein CEXT_462441 [Caerostris extrusa]|uniref:Uncharacterized protein n=1 Tax=Caerostris extrusa TaxID=172846 RepID=A0AAV4WL58_CAEEX|nr:hypothetical protein CEXT_462441 [Caerostris extrusa]